jgi:hypothetical protein
LHQTPGGREELLREGGRERGAEALELVDQSGDDRLGPKNLLLLLVERLAGGDVAVGVGKVELEAVVADAKLEHWPAERSRASMRPTLPLWVCASQRSGSRRSTQLRRGPSRNSCARLRKTSSLKTAASAGQLGVGAGVIEA